MARTAGILCQPWQLRRAPCCQGGWVGWSTAPPQYCILSVTNPHPPPCCQAFDDIDGLLEGPEGFDSSSSVWHATGWREVAALRRKLEDLRELRELVRQLGRGGGKGPLKKAPEQVYNSKSPPGVIRSPLQPEETRGLTRSGEAFGGRGLVVPGQHQFKTAGWAACQPLPRLLSCCRRPEPHAAFRSAPAGRGLAALRARQRRRHR